MAEMKPDVPAPAPLTVPGMQALAPMRRQSLAASDGTQLVLRVAPARQGQSQSAAGQARPPVLMLHGLQSHSGWFAQSQSALAAAGYTVYAADRRGAGLSGGRRGDCEDLALLLDDMERLRELAAQETGHATCYVMGHCFGAIPALLYAAAHGETLSGLVLASPACYTHAAPSTSEKVKIGLALLAGGRATTPIPYPDEHLTDDPAWRAAIAADPLALRSVTARFLYQIKQAREALTAAAESLRIPVFTALAGQDLICDNEANRTLFAHIDERLHRQADYPGARHILEYSPDMQAFFGDLIEWLATTH